MDIAQTPGESVNDSVALGAYGISYRWPQFIQNKETLDVLTEISLELSKGEIIALLGPNGAGKSTLMKIMAGMISLRTSGNAGLVRYQGRDFLSLPSYRRAQLVVYVPPEIRAEFPLTALEAVYLGRTCQRQGWLQKNSKPERTLVQWAMEKCLCWSLRDRYLDQLSTGERQLVALAQALAQGSQVLFLDETLSKMDLSHQSQIGKLLKELAHEGRSIILVSHDINMASEWADRVVFLSQGRIVLQGKVKEVLTHEKLNSLYPDASLVIGTHPTTGMPKVFFG